MTTTIEKPFTLASVFLWLGFVFAISFLEAWLKFQAPGVTISIGLGIGKLVFAALNKVEWFFVIVIIAENYFNKNKYIPGHHLYFLIAVLLLLIQTIWLLPALDARADLEISGKSLPASNLHIYFVAAELVKVACLFTTGIKSLKKIKV